MGCLFWSDFDPKHRQNLYLEDDDEKRDLYRAKMVLFLIQYRKYINYFVEQSLILGMWGQFQHEVIAISSILIARFEMKSIEQVRWKKKKVSDDSLQLLKTYNKLLNTYKNISSDMVKNCVMKIYSKVYNGA